jgi:hypothetical protein
MDKRILQRKSGKLIAAAAAASAGLMGWGTTQKADASLVIDLRATSATNGGVISADKKSVSVAAGVTTITMAVIARISGTNATQVTGDWANNGSTTTANDDTLQIITGSFKSTGLLQGNLNTAAGPLTYNSRINPYIGSGSVNGTASDWDSDGDLDIGNAGTDPSTMFSGRSASPSFAYVGSGTGWSQGEGASSGGNANDTVVDPTTSELQIGVLRFITSGAGGPNTLLSFVPRPATDPGSALWFEDGASTGKTPGTGAFLSGVPVTVNAVPEPATLGLLGIAGLGLLARRKKN